MPWMVIGPPIPTKDRKPEEIMADVESWIEGKMAEISSIPNYPISTED